ncbi:hypothetical protein KSP39_PZI002686 [Platanthera zijinensis]|uniref:Uncharacterized protein n=1 Tax=Platanthera zijinensis TaxID=2320716 RepID=A0AAP0BZ42_9ASPA
MNNYQNFLKVTNTSLVNLQFLTSMALGIHFQRDIFVHEYYEMFSYTGGFCNFKVNGGAIVIMQTYIYIDIYIIKIIQMYI